MWATITVLLLLSLSTRESKAQQDPMYTQYMFNTLAINPAYAGTRDMLSLMLLSRHQWVGFEGAPSTQTLTAHSPVANKNIGLGLSLIHDHLGPTRQTGLYFDYSFQVKMNEALRLSFGLKGGFNYYQLDMTQLNRLTPYDDPAYNDPNISKLLPNFGFGLYLYSTRFYLGLSAPKLLENKFSTEGDIESEQTGKETRHYFITSGAVFDLSNEVKFKPSILTRLAEASPISFDMNVNFLFKEKLWVGGMYRISNSFGAIVQYQITKQFKIGYAFDMTTNELRNYNSGTHEIMINYEFNFNKEEVQNPRYF